MTERAIGNKWLVTEGLKAGERVIVLGLQFAKPGAKVSPQELPDEAAPATATPPATGASGSAS